MRTIKKTFRLFMLTLAVLAASFTNPTNAEEINLGEYCKAAGFGEKVVSLKTLLLYGTDQLRAQQNELQKQFRAADEFDKPALQKQLVEHDALIKAKREEIKGEVFYQEFDDCSPFSVKMDGETSSFALDVSQGLIPIGRDFGKFVSPFPDVKAVIRENEYDAIETIVGEATNEIQPRWHTITISGSTDSIRTLVRGMRNRPKEYSLKLWFTELQGGENERVGLDFTNPFGARTWTEFIVIARIVKIEIVKKTPILDPEAVSNTPREIQVLVSQEKYEEALKITMQLQEQFPKEPQWILLLIEIYSKQNSYDKALALVEERLMENPDEIRWIMLKSQLFTEQKKWGDAINWLKSCLQKKPVAQKIDLLLVSVLADSKKYEEAKERIKPLLEKEPENLLLLRLDSQISISMGLHYDAIKTLTKIIELDPTDYTSVNNLAWIFSTSPIDSVRNGQKALELAGKACELSQYKKAFILSTLAAAYAELGNFDKAREWSQKSIDLATTEKGNTDEEHKEFLDNLLKELETFKEDEPYREYIDIVEK